GSAACALPDFAASAIGLRFLCDPDSSCEQNRSRWKFKEFECGHGFYRKIERLEYRAATMVARAMRPRSR
ncbi:MAG TPA: hypothetical protein VHN11_13220, partial [Xanthobacteraceae bacterium]|nr:hypothetical protein [Xanthobacteraceae bacterium]